MKNKYFSTKLLFLIFFAIGITACSSASADQSTLPAKAAAPETAQKPAEADPSGKNVVILSKITIQDGTPSAAIRSFFKAMREKRFVDAMMMTNMKAAVEGLTLEEIKDLEPDFAPMAAQIPADLVITGEQISGDKASVFLRLPGETPGNPATEEMKLRKEADKWVIISSENEADEAKAKKQGKAYFFNVRIDMHHLDVENMLKQIMQAQSIFSLDGKGQYGERDVLIRQGLLPVDISGSYSTGYNFSIVLSADKKSYFVNAVPAVYGKSGKLSFLMEVAGSGSPKTKSNDNGGMPLKK